MAEWIALLDSVSKVLQDSSVDRNVAGFFEVRDAPGEATFIRALNPMIQSARHVFNIIFAELFADSRVVGSHIIKPL